MELTFPRLALVPPSIDRSTYLLRKLIPNAKENDPEVAMVAVATGFATKGLEYAKRAGLSAGDARGLVETATKNLVASGGREWIVSEKAGLIFKKPSLLRAQGTTGVSITAMATDNMGFDDLSADLILDEAFMAKAGELLGGQELIAAIPKRGWLLVGKCQPGQFPVMMKFAQIAEGIAGRGGKDALATACFFIKSGKLHGISGKGYLSLVTGTDLPWNVQ